MPLSLIMRKTCFRDLARKTAPLQLDMKSRLRSVDSKAQIKTLRHVEIAACRIDCQLHQSNMLYIHTTQWRLKVWKHLFVFTLKLLYFAVSCLSLHVLPWCIFPSVFDCLPCPRLFLPVSDRLHLPSVAGVSLVSLSKCSLSVSLRCTYCCVSPPYSKWSSLYLKV